MMKKLFFCLLAAAFLVCAAACAEYSPKQADFELDVTLTSTEANCGEDIGYTVTIRRVSGQKFSVQGSSTLYSVYFEPKTGEEPYFAYNADVVTHNFGEDYLLEENKTLSTQGYAAGEYLFAVQARIGGLEYNYERSILLK